MKRIETFNTELNKSNFNTGTGLLEYKKQVSNSIEKAIKLLPKRDKVCIIGAGKMSDFDITIFLRFFDEVIITDIDLTSVNETINYLRLPAKLRKKITIVRTEYTGFEINHFFDDFKERIVNCYTFEKIEQVLESKLKGLDRYKFLKEYENDLDFIFVSPIYTQLIYNQLMRECSVLRETGYPEHLIKFIENYMLDQMIPVIDRFNSNLISRLQKDGRLMVLSDIFQLDVKSDFYKRIEHSIKNYDVIEEIYNGYKEKYGMGLGDYGLYNLDEQMKRSVSKWMIWPFTDKQSFIIKLNIFIK